MARRRYISTEISIDSKIAKLAGIGGVLPVLLYTWMIPHAEDNGTITADPFEISLMVLPGFRQLTDEDISKAIDAIIEAGLMIKLNGKLQFPLDNFYKYQSNLPKDKREFLASGGDIEDWNEIKRKNYKAKKEEQQKFDSSAEKTEQDNFSADKMQRNTEKCKEMQKMRFDAPSPSLSPSLTPSLPSSSNIILYKEASVKKIAEQLKGNKFFGILHDSFIEYLLRYHTEKEILLKIESATEHCKINHIEVKQPRDFLEAWIKKKNGNINPRASPEKSIDDMSSDELYKLRQAELEKVYPTLED